MVVKTYRKPKVRLLQQLRDSKVSQAMILLSMGAENFHEFLESLCNNYFYNEKIKS